MARGLPQIHFLRVRGRLGELEALSGSRSQALQRFNHIRRMDLQFPPSQAIEQAWADIPIPLEGKARAIMNPIGTAAELAILRLHQQELETIWGSQILGNPCLTNRFFPEDAALLAAQPIPVL